MDDKGCWNFTYNNWNKKFKYLLIKDGKIHYSFHNKVEAKTFSKEFPGFFLDQLFTTKKAKEMGIYPEKAKSWAGKEQCCTTFDYSILRE